MTTSVKIQGPSLKIVAVVEKRTRSGIYVFGLDDQKTPILVTEANLATEGGRTKAIARLPKPKRAEATSLLLRLAAMVAIKKTKRSDDSNPSGRGRAILQTPIEPWPEPVDGAALLDEVDGLIARFMVMEMHQRHAAALWVAHAHAHDASHVSPILMISAPEKRSGKTTLANVLGALVPRPLQSANVSAAVLYRSVDRYRPTMIIDEVDTFLGERDEIIGIINSGHNRTNAFVMRVGGADQEAREFSTWSPKILAGIGASHDKRMGPLIDRSIVIDLRRRKDSEAVESLRLDRLDSEFEPTRRRLTRWAADHLEALRVADPELPVAAGFHDRARDHWRALIAIADRAEGKWPSRGRAAALHLTAAQASHGNESHGVLLLGDIREFLAQAKSTRVTTVALLEWLNAREDRPWAEWSHGKPLTPSQLAKLLRAYDITPIKMRVKTAILRGYDAPQFTDSFARYLPAEPPQPPHATGTTTYDLPRPATRELDVAPPKASNF